ncbi:hypothetical protein D3C85_599890 [compost metagenome]
MRHRQVHLRPAFLTHGPEQAVQRRFQFSSGETRRQCATHHLAWAFVLNPITGANLPQVQRQRPVQRTCEVLQVPCATAHVVDVGTLLGIQRPDHPVEGTPAGQAAAALNHHIVQFVLHTAAPEQHGVIINQPMVPGQAGRDSLDLFGFTDDDQQADIVTP